MKFRGLLTAAIVLAALGGGLWWSNRQKAAEAAKPATSSDNPKIVDLKQDDITRIEIRKKGAGDTVLEKAGANWKITAPKPYGADQDAVNSILTSLSPLTSDHLVEEKASNLATFGLNDPSASLTATTKDGKTHQILLGDDVPTGGSTYAAVPGDPRVFTIATYTKDNFEKGVNDLRDKRLLTFDSDKLTRVDLTAKGQSIEFGKNNQNEWQILQPKPARADGLQVEELIRKLKEAKMDLSQPADAAAKAVAAYASGSQIGIAKVTDGSGTQTLTVRKDKAGDYYARSSVVDGVFKVSNDLGTGLDKSLLDFRNKKLFDFGFSEPSKIEMRDGAKSYQFQRAGESWMSGGKKMDNVSVQSLLDKLRDLSASDFPDTGFGTPAIDITIVSNDGKRTEKVSISGSGEKYIAKRDNEASLYALDGKAVRELQQAASDVKPAAPEKKKK
ncbi:MAG TPA: DUF4340 domain-containing protein [Bryobacteraceae bacterium]|jgi:hypothetical protein|nr:DUF4340 domain-containing protein [Bryobacteraceae bacterium]